MNLHQTLIISTLFLSSLFSGLVYAEQKIIQNQSSIQFVSKQMGVPVEGSFKKFDAQIDFNPQKLESSKVQFQIDLNSATIGVPETDAELSKSTWFNVAQFPKANFQATAIKKINASQFEASGKLNIKGISQEIRIPISIAQSADVSTATGQFSIKRLAFKIGDGEWGDTSLVADDVQVRFKIALTGMAKL